jgi:integrase
MEANAMSPSAPTRLTTARTVAVLKPRATRYAVPDTQVAGLDLRVHPDGRKVWTLRFRTDGQQRRLKLGEYDRMGLADARQAAKAALRKVDGGLDPQAEKRAKKRAAVEAKRAAALAKRDSIEALCASYIERHARPKKRTWRDDQSKITCEILPAWKGRPVSSITRRDCRALVQGIADRDAPILANRVAALLSRLFRFAVDEELLETNPAAQLPKPGVEFGARPQAERPDKPYDADEIRTIWAATEGLAPAARALYRLSMITGQRPGELGGMTWDEIDGQWWTIPASRTKNRREHRVFLSALATEALDVVPRIQDEPLVFAGYRGKRQLAELNAKVFAKVRDRAKPRHAMRDTAAGGMAQAGVAIDDVSRVLNHSVGLRVTAGYNAYAYDREKMIALSTWARRLASIIENNAVQASTVVVPFRG